jgi:ubiquinone/menaquinone biosynthesis C-methylase UbiE
MTDPHPRVPASYDRVAEQYEAAFGDELNQNPLHRALLDCFVTLVSTSGGDGPIGDVGCGPGHVAAYLSQRGLRVVAIDLSPRMVDVARRRYPDLDVRVGSMTSLDVPDAVWAGLVAIYSIIHLPIDDRRQAYREFARVLRPGAWILVAFHVDSASTQPATRFTSTSFSVKRSISTATSFRRTRSPPISTKPGLTSRLVSSAPRCPTSSIRAAGRISLAGGGHGDCRKMMELRLRD